MAREIRITVDDNEVFERMKARKQELDLSWREVLQRGLWGAGSDRGGTAGYGPDPAEHAQLEQAIRRRVEDSLRSAFGVEPPDARPRSGTDEQFEDEVETLTTAENAVLRFPFLPDEPGYRVPLRVTLETRAGGLDVEVVTVREGKDVEGMNDFDRRTRREVAERLAGGADAVLELETDVEEYRVEPVLTWRRTDRNRPVVADVSIEEVVFDADGR